MFLPHKKNTLKQRAYEFYNSYRGTKVTRPTFYWRVRAGGSESREEKIKTKLKNDKRRIPKGRWAEELTRYNEQPEPRSSKCLFRNRLNNGYPKEEAILIGDERLKVRREKKIAYPIVQKTYIPKPKVVKPIDERDFKIEITYPKEVAQVFRREYSRMIEQLERDLTYTDEKTQVAELNKKLEQLEKELQTFNSYNPR